MDQSLVVGWREEISAIVSLKGGQHPGCGQQKPSKCNKALTR